MLNCHHNILWVNHWNSEKNVWFSFSPWWIFFFVLTSFQSAYLTNIRGTYRNGNIVCRWEYKKKPNTWSSLSSDISERRPFRMITLPLSLSLSLSLSQTSTSSFHILLSFHRKMNTGAATTLDLDLSKGNYLMFAVNKLDFGRGKSWGGEERSLENFLGCSSFFSLLSLL